MSETRPKVTFITVCYKTPAMIRQLLKGFEEAKLPFAFEYFLVDNGAKNGDAATTAMVHELFPWVTVLNEQGNVGFGAGNNLAIAKAKGEYIMFVNPDLTVFPGELEKLVAFADANPKIGLIGPKLLNPDRTLQRTFCRFPSLLTPVLRRTPLGQTRWGSKAVDSYLMMDVNPTLVQDVDGLFGMAILARADALQQIGNFDEGFFMYFEDVDLCRRAWEKGWRVTYAPVATFVHYHQRESKMKRPWDFFTNRVLRIHLKSAWYYFWKYRGKPSPRESGA